MKQFRPAITLFIILSIITGIMYPFVVTWVSREVFAYQANGSLLVVNGQVIGSELIGQSFESNKYLWGRVSATADLPYNALSSGGSNFAPTNPQLISEVKDRLAKLNPASNTPVPVDLVTSSASGLDPEISVAAAYFQMDRIAKARGMTVDQVEDIINQYAEYPLLGIWGEARVNVLKVNLALDKIKYEVQQ